MDAFTPQQTMELISRIGQKKSKMRLDKLWWNSVLAGPLLGFGCAITLSTNAAPWYQENAPGLIRTIAASFFPIGLILVVLTGADLYTSNVMFLPVAYLHRRASLLDIAKSWVLSFFGNLAGMLFFCRYTVHSDPSLRDQCPAKALHYGESSPGFSPSPSLVICGYGGVFESAAWKEESIKFAVTKAVTAQWHQIFLKAIGANWLVCLAVFMSISSREIVSKIISIWWPIMTFVGLGMDHVIANMFLIPIGIFNGAPIGVGYYIWKSMIPALIGNTIGGGFFVGVVYWYLYMTGDEAVSADFDKLEMVHRGALTAVDENAGPVHRADGHEYGPKV
ncbi:hypothetical protein LTR85_011629 [Meristemomyces frigidus]|nr:hypothetical protein LTR85_011629 [Meristemomyces frigidus]